LIFKSEFVSVYLSLFILNMGELVLLILTDQFFKIGAELIIKMMDQLTDFEIDRATTMNLGEFHFNIEIHIRGDGRVGENTLEEYYSRRIRGLYVCACVVG